MNITGKAKFKYKGKDQYGHYNWLCTDGVTFYRGTLVFKGSVFSYPANLFWSRRTR